MSQADEHLLRIDNWAGTHGSCALEVYHPKTQDKVKAIISKERDLGHKLKAMGAGHSPNDIFCLQDKQGSSIDVRDMSELWGISKENMTVTVGAGMLLSKLVALLSQEVMAFSVQPDYQWGTVGGMISTGTHGHGYKHGSLSSLVEELTLVTVSGDILTCSKGAHSDIYQASLIGLGLTGIITKVKLCCVPSFSLEETVYTTTFSKFVDQVDHVMCGAEYTKAAWWPEFDDVTVISADRTEKPPSPAKSNVLASIWSVYIKFYLLQTLLYIAYFLGDPYIRSIWKAYYVLSIRPSAASTKVKTFVSAFTGDNRMKQRMYEGCVPMEHMTMCLRELHQWLAAELKIESGIRRNLNVFMRVVEAEDIWLSPTYKSRGVYLSIIEFMPYGKDLPSYKRSFTAFEAILKKHQARPHWGKDHYYSRDELLAAFPKLPNFLTVRQQLDPAAIFINEYAHRDLGLQAWYCTIMLLNPEDCELEKDGYLCRSPTTLSSLWEVVAKHVPPRV